MELVVEGLLSTGPTPSSLMGYTGCFIKLWKHTTTYTALEDEVGLRPGRPVNNGPQEGDYPAWVALRKGKVGLPGLSLLYPLSLFPRLPRQSSPPPVAYYLQGAMA